MCLVSAGVLLPTQILALWAISLAAQPCRPRTSDPSLWTDERRDCLFVSTRKRGQSSRLFAYETLCLIGEANSISDRGPVSGLLGEVPGEQLSVVRIHVKASEHGDIILRNTNHPAYKRWQQFSVPTSFILSTYSHRRFDTANMANRRALIVPALKKHTATVIMAHGLGDSGAGWVSLAENWRRRGKFDEVKFVFPNAPSIPITIVRRILSHAAAY